MAKRNVAPKCKAPMKAHASYSHSFIFFEFYQQWLFQKVKAPFHNGAIYICIVACPPHGKGKNIIFNERKLFLVQNQVSCIIMPWLMKFKHSNRLKSEFEMKLPLKYAVIMTNENSHRQDTKEILARQNDSFVFVLWISRWSALLLSRSFCHFLDSTMSEKMNGGYTPLVISLSPHIINI